MLLRGGLAAAVLLLVVVAAGNAGATMYGIEDPVPFSNGTLAGTIRNDVGPTNPGDIVCLTGGATCDLSLDIVVFTIEVDAGTLDELGFTIYNTFPTAPANAVGMGYFSSNVTGTNVTAPGIVPSGFNINIPDAVNTTAPKFLFTGLSSGTSGGFSKVLFLTYAANTVNTSLAGALQPGLATFMFSELNVAGDFNAFGVLTPEPSSALLLGGGLLGLLAVARRRRSS